MREQSHPETPPPRIRAARRPRLVGELRDVVVRWGLVLL
jgi:hypothetical protein